MHDPDRGIVLQQRVLDQLGDHEVVLDSRM